MACAAARADVAAKPRVRGVDSCTVLVARGTAYREGLVAHPNLQRPEGLDSWVKVFGAHEADTVAAVNNHRLTVCWGDCRLIPSQYRTA